MTASGTYLPVRDLIRMDTPAYHYLTIFDGGTGRAPWLGRTRPIAYPDQRIALHTKDRGCWRTNKLTNGRTQWTPPPQLPLPSTTNNYHHPKQFLDVEQVDEPD